MNQVLRSTEPKRTGCGSSKILDILCSRTPRIDSTKAGCAPDFCPDRSGVEVRTLPGLETQGVYFAPRTLTRSDKIAHGCPDHISCRLKIQTVKNPINDTKSPSPWEYSSIVGKLCCYRKPAHDRAELIRLPGSPLVDRRITRLCLPSGWTEEMVHCGAFASFFRRLGGQLECPTSAIVSNAASVLCSSPAMG